MEMGRDGAVGQGVHAWAVPEFLLPLEDKACFGAQIKVPGAVGSFALLHTRMGC